ncbi:hypothetical protein [Paenibacillus eucommiae]|uniref:GNAT family N-acetyltransferase n=1 Tax=Paenibacillus eucommiae TaxID=1355755 RepID=A0ABS4ISH6_9BACL|nr:hypothetical protein [Paenibacillus eucommiae]MBP1990527.1 hypothetical protein [Paenibacillus eucommiae]
MITHCKRCISDEDFAKVSLFVMVNKHDLHLSFTTLDMLSLLYTYVTQGHLVQATDADERVIGAAAYFHGTQEHDFKDKEIAIVDMVIIDKAYRGTSLFVKGFGLLVDQIIEAHPEVEEIRFVALSENTYVSNLYAKMAESSYTREGKRGEETVYCGKVHSLRGFLERLKKV